MTKDTFERHIQEVTLPVELRDGTVHNLNGNPFHVNSMIWAAKAHP